MAWKLHGAGATYVAETHERVAMRSRAETPESVTCRNRRHAAVMVARREHTYHKVNVALAGVT